MARTTCFDCGRPQSVCLCSELEHIQTRTRVVILQHPRESAVPVGTARLAERVLQSAELHVGLEFEGVAAAQRALQDPAAPAILLYPGPGARDLREDPPAHPVTLVVIDGTWWQAQKLLKLNPWLSRLPRYALTPSEPSRYRIRREPADHCVSTIEAISMALAVLEGSDTLIARALRPFDALVEQQLQFAARHQQHRHLARKRTPRRPRLIELLATRHADLVVGYGEANAWPRGTPLGAHPEVVHWAAERISSGERFEAFIRPQHPLAPSFAHHTRLELAQVHAGETGDGFCQRWREFIRPSDVLVSWGYFASELLRTSGAHMPEILDMRSAARRLVRGKLGDIERAALTLGAAPEAAWAPGRTGVRLSALSALTRALLAPATESRHATSELTPAHEDSMDARGTL